LFGVLIVNVASVIFVVIACPLIWMMIIVPVVARQLGVPFKVGILPINRRDPRLGKRQSFWLAGVLGWGVGISLFGILTAQFMDHKHLTVSKLLLGVISCTVVSALLSQEDWTYPIDND
jgi:hypothetical protein